MTPGRLSDDVLLALVQVSAMREAGFHALVEAEEKHQAMLRSLIERGGEAERLDGSGVA